MSRDRAICAFLHELALDNSERLEYYSRITGLTVEDLLQETRELLVRTQEFTNE